MNKKHRIAKGYLQDLSFQHCRINLKESQRNSSRNPPPQKKKHSTNQTRRDVFDFLGGEGENAENADLLDQLNVAYKDTLHESPEHNFKRLLI